MGKFFDLDLENFNQNMKIKIALFIFFTFSLFSCNKQSLSEEEISVINKFLTWQWYDLEMVTFSGETIPNEASFEFKVEGGKLRHLSNTYYSASFGDKHYQSEGDVNLYYDKENQGIALELLNEEGEILQSGLITIPKDQIISGLENQIKNRNKIASILENRKFSQLPYGEFDQKGIFESKILNSFQSEDFSMNYMYSIESHLEELGDFKPYKIEGFVSTAGQSFISWELREVYKDSKTREINYDDLKTSFDKEEVASLMIKLQGTLKFFDSNIATKESFKSGDFKIDFDPNFSLVIKDEYSSYEEPISELEVPINGDTYSFLNSWYSGEGNALLSFEIVKSDREEYIVEIDGSDAEDFNAFGEFNVFVNLNSNFNTGGKNWLRIYQDKFDPNRVYFFNQNKYFTLISAN